MADTTFNPGTVIAASWLNDVNALVYHGQSGLSGTTNRTALSKLAETVSVKDFGAVGDGVADDTAAITAAITSVTTSFGAVHIPRGIYKITSTLPAPRGVSVYGDGGIATVIKCYDCDGFTSTAGVAWDQNMVFYRDFTLQAITGTNRTGFRVATLPYSGEQDGYYLRNLRFFGWDTSIYFGSCWQSYVTECYIENTNTGIRMDGHAVLDVIDKCQIIHGSGGFGAATNLGVHFGTTDIEANILSNSFIYGFQTCVKMDEPWHCTVKDNTMLSAAPPGTGGMIGISFTTVKEHLNITGNMIEAQVQAGSSFTGIFGAPTFTPSNGQTVIQNNRIWDDLSAGASSIGIQLNDAGNTNQNNVVIENNNFTGFTTYDIVVYNGNNIAVQHNDCRSSGVPTYNIVFSGSQTAVFARENRCAKAIFAESAYAINGQLRLDNNTQAGAFVGLRNNATYDPGSLADGAGVTTTVTVTGAALGDFAQASFSLDLQGITVTAWVSAANTVSVRFQNESGGVLDLASGTLRVRVTPQI